MSGASAQPIRAQGGEKRLFKGLRPEGAPRPVGSSGQGVSPGLLLITARAGTADPGSGKPTSRNTGSIASLFLKGRFQNMKPEGLTVNYV